MHRISILCGAALLALVATLAAASSPAVDATARGAAFIRSTQQPDGGFGGFGDGQTMDAVFALRAAGIDPNTVTTGGTSPADFLKAKAPAQTKPGSAAKAALAAKALGLDPRAVAGTDLVSAISTAYNPADGRFAADDFTQGLALVGLGCTGNGVPASAVLALRHSQGADGGWGFEGASDPDTTAIVVQGLIAAGVPRDDTAVAKAVAYFRATQSTDGGWGFDPSESNASSTAFVVQALLAAHEDAEGAAYRRGTDTPLTFLLAQQLPDGSFKGFDPAFATNQVLPALAGRSFCDAPNTVVRPASAAPSATPKPPATGTGTAGEAAVPWFAAGAASVLALSLVASALVLRRH